MSNRSSFISSIVSEPDEDTHRLVFADWLTENNEPDLGEFIRAQIEMSRWSGADLPVSAEENERRTSVKRRKDDLFARHKAEWVRGLVCEQCEGRGEWISTYPPTPSSVRCSECFGTGDSGGLLRTFDYGTSSSSGALISASIEPVRVTFARGLPDAISVPQLSDVCEFVSRDEFRDAVPGRWQLTPWLLAVLRAHPVMSVVAINVLPWNSGNYRWGWSKQSNDVVHGQHAWVIPEGIFDRLENSNQVATTNPNRAWWTSNELAVAALGRAVATWGRSFITQER